MENKNELNDIVKRHRRKHPRKRDPRELVSSWSEKDVLGSDVVDAFVMILRTQGCSWALQSGCSMCGYINDAAHTRVEAKDIIHQFEAAMQRFSSESMVKVFTSGSFINEDEMPVEARERILRSLSNKTEKIIVESRPEFVNEGHLHDLEKLVGLGNLEIAIGLESASNIVLEHSINKGFRVEDYKRAAQLLNERGIDLRTYLLIKPPFLNEKEAIDDAIYSAKIAAQYSRTISFNPVNIQRFTLMERLWKNREYRPPWLWSVVEVLKRSKGMVGTRNNDKGRHLMEQGGEGETGGKGGVGGTDSVRFMSAPTAGGKKRGAHNCGECDSRVLKAISEFSLAQDVSILDDLDCGCKKLWMDVLAAEEYALTHGDLTRLV